MTASLRIAVCGCGPAGLAAALLLHRAGHRVCMIERFAEPKPLGSGLILQPTGMAVLEELGVRSELQMLGARIDRLFGRAVPSKRVVLDVSYAAMGSRWHGLAVHRAALFDVLYRAVVQASIPVLTGIDVTHAEPSGSSVLLRTHAGVADASYDLIVDALGSRSPLIRPRRVALAYGALWVNVPWPHGGFLQNALEQRYRRASHMAGVLPIGRASLTGQSQAAFFWSLRHHQFDDWRARSINDWKQHVEQLWPEAANALTSIVDHEQITFARYTHFTLPRPHTQRVVQIGDAAHSTSPQLGQGANMALLDALALARALTMHGTVEHALPAYAQFRRWHVRIFQAASAVFTPFYQSNSRLLPWLRDQVAAPLSRLPIADALLARLVSGMTLSPLRGTHFRAWRPSA